MKNQFISVNTIFSKLNRDFKSYKLNKNDVIEWVGEAIRGIGVESIYEPAIRFVEVKNFSCDIPELAQLIIQIAKNNKPEQMVTPEDTTIPDQGVLIDNNGTPVEGYEIAYYRPYFDMVGAFIVGNVVSGYKDKFVPVRLTNHTFFDSHVCRDENFGDLYHSAVDEYNIIGNTLKFSFPEGQVAIAYLRLKVDCDGYPMIPDTYSAITAVTKYCIMKLMENDYYSHRQGSDSRLQKAESDWQWYCSQASNEGKIPSGIDEWESLLNQHKYILPKKTQYNNFFENLSRPELKPYFK